MSTISQPIAALAVKEAKRPNFLTRNLTAKIAMIPLVATSLFIFLGCALWSVFYSFTSSRLLPTGAFVGLDQYERLFTTARWYTSMTNVVIFGVLSMTFSLVIGFVLAALIDQKIRFENTFRSIYLHPFAMSFIVTGLVWQWILNPLNGIEKVMRDLVGRPSSSTGSRAPTRPSTRSSLPRSGRARASSWL